MANKFVESEFPQGVNLHWFLINYNGLGKIRQEHTVIITSKYEFFTIKLIDELEAELCKVNNYHTVFIKSFSYMGFKMSSEVQG